MLIGFVLLVVLGFGLPYLYAVYVTYKKTKSDELWKKNSIERNTPVFRPGTCIASRSEILGVPINFEVFEEVPCPDYLKDVPLCAVATKKEVVRND